MWNYIKNIQKHSSIQSKNSYAKLQITFPDLYLTIYHPYKSILQTRMNTNRIGLQNAILKNAQTTVLLTTVCVASSHNIKKLIWCKRTPFHPASTLLSLFIHFNIHPHLHFNTKQMHVFALAHTHAHTYMNTGLIMQLLMRCSVCSEGGESRGINDRGERRQLEKEGGYSWSKRGIKSTPSTEGR